MKKIILFSWIDRFLSFATHVHNDNVICKFINSNVQMSRAPKRKLLTKTGWERIHTFAQSGIHGTHTHRQKHPWKIYTQQRYWCLSTLVTPFDSTFRDTHIANGMQRMRSDGVGKASKMNDITPFTYIDMCAVRCCAMCIHTHSQTQMIPLMGN